MASNIDTTLFYLKDSLPGCLSVGQKNILLRILSSMDSEGFVEFQEVEYEVYGDGINRVRAIIRSSIDNCIFDAIEFKTRTRNQRVSQLSTGLHP